MDEGSWLLSLHGLGRFVILNIKGVSVYGGYRTIVF